MTNGLPFHVSRLTRQLSREIPEMLEDHHLPGLAIAICDASGVLWSAAFGVKGEGGAAPVTTETMFSVQSIAKLYSATAAMLAVQDGLVELDVPITTYLPEFSVRSMFETHPERRITLRHLLSHTAGFTHEAPVGNNYMAGQASFAAHCRSIADTWLRFPVGHHYEYSNLGFDLAAYVLQCVTQLPFHEFVRRRLLVPLGLRRTTFDQRAIARDLDRAVGHSTRPKRVLLRIPMVGAGGLYTSVLDAGRFVQFHLQHGAPLLEMDRADEMSRVPFAHAEQTFGYGLGMISFLWDGILVRGHSGGGFGFLADLYWAPDPGIGVVVLTNSVNHPLQGALARRVLTELAGGRAEKELAGGRAEKVAPTLPSYPVSAEVAGRLSGEYVGRMGWQTIAAEESCLFLITDEVRQRLRVVAPDEVMLEDDPHERFRILPDGDGIPRYLLRLSDGLVWYRNEAAPGVSPPAWWAEIEAEYAIEAQGVRISRVRLGTEGDCLLYEESPGAHGLRLKEYQPGIFYASTGEVLDLTQDSPTYANIQLRRLPNRG